MASRATLRGTDPKKVSGELFALTYGALVAQILKVFQHLRLSSTTIGDTDIKNLLICPDTVIHSTTSVVNS